MLLTIPVQYRLYVCTSLRCVPFLSRFEESGDKSVSFLREGSDSDLIGQLPPGKSIPFAQHGLYNDVSGRTATHSVCQVHFYMYTCIPAVHSVGMFNAHLNMHVLGLGGICY